MTVATPTSSKLTAVVGNIIVRLEDDGYPITVMSCRCPETGEVEDMTYPSEFWDHCRYQDKWAEIQPRKFPRMAAFAAAEFIRSRKERGDGEGGAS